MAKPTIKALPFACLPFELLLLCSPLPSGVEFTVVSKDDPCFSGCELGKTYYGVTYGVDPDFIEAMGLEPDDVPSRPIAFQDDEGAWCLTVHCQPCISVVREYTQDECDIQEVTPDA